MLRTIQTGGGPASKARAGSQSASPFQPIQGRVSRAEMHGRRLLARLEGPQDSRREDAPVRQPIAAQPGPQGPPPVGPARSAVGGSRTMRIPPIEWQLDDDRQHAPRLPHRQSE